MSIRTATGEDRKPSQPSGIRPTRRKVWPAGWWFDLVMLAVFGLITAALVDNRLLRFDLAAMSWSDAHRTATAWWISYTLSCLGQGGPLTIGTFAISGFLAWSRRSIRPLLLPATAFVLTYMLIGPIKLWSQRAAPHKGPVEMFAHPTVVDGSGMAYPSGHVANSIVWWGILALILGPYLPPAVRWFLRVGMPATVAITMVYSDYHWLTDVVASVPLALVLSRLLYRIPWDAIPLRLPLWRRADPRPPDETGGAAGRPVAEPAQRRSA